MDANGRCVKQQSSMHGWAANSPWRVLPLLLALLIAAATHAAQVGDLIVARSGTLPILLTAPHGGTEAIPGMQNRTGNLAVVTMDARTLEFAEALAGRLKSVLGAEPYVVAARFHRRYIDVNRRANEAFEDVKAEPYYAAYHNRIRGFVSEIRQKFPRGALLLDIHGQGSDPNTLHRGTANGWTVEKLIATHGAAALIGEKSLFGVFSAKGREVFPPNTRIGNPPEDKRYNGGYTVRTYGSNNRDGIDAIQLEFGANQRKDPRVVNDLAEAISVFYKTYLNVDKRSP